nr:MAG: putative RNA-dependent RNA polymerase [Polycipiviridae sp.]
MSTYNQFATVSGRKKFGVSSRINNELRREIRRATEWVHKTPGDLLKLFEFDSNRRFLPVRGNSVIKFSYSSLDVLSLLRTFSVEVKAAQNGRKLHQSPLFSRDYTACLTCVEGLDVINIENHDVEKISDGYMEGSVLNPEFPFDFTTINTYSTCLYELFDIYKKYGISSLEQRLYKELSTLKFKRLDPYGIYIFILHLKIRGLAPAEPFKKLEEWKTIWRTLTNGERQCLINNVYAKGSSIHFRQMIRGNLLSKIIQDQVLRHEFKLVRHNIAETGIIPPSFLLQYLTFKEGVKDQMTDVERYRDSCGMTLQPLQGQFTMFSPTNTIKNGIKGAIDESMPEVKQQISEAVQEMLQSDEIKNSVKDLMTESLQPTVDSFGATIPKAGNTVLENLKTSMQPVIDQTFSLFSSLNGLVSFFRSLVDQAISIFPTDMFGGTSTIKFDVDTILSLLKYYIVYIHVTSRPLKAAIVYLMLKELGLLEYLLKWGGQIFKMIFGNGKEDLTDVPLQPGEVVMEPTSATDWMSSLVDMLLRHKNEVGMCTFFASILLMIFKGVMKNREAGTFRYNEYSTLAGIVLGMCKGCHWVGSGMFGIERIFKYFNIIVQSVTKFIREKILGINEDAAKNEKLVAKWLISLKFFSTDTGRNAIRVSKPLLERAEKIMSEGLGFIAAASKDPKFISRDTLMLIHRSWSDVKTLSNYVYRLRSTSQFKPAMFHVQFVGEPGIGKSTLTEKFISQLSSKIHPADKNITHWTYNPNIEHFDTYNGQTYMIIDDLFRYNEPQHLSLIIGLITNTPVPLPMAHLEDKGQHLDSDILLSSTNTPYPIGKDIFCMEAVHRRRHILCEVNIDARVKKDGKFSKELFDQYYPGQKSYDFPHLKFSLMKPVVLPGESVYQNTDASAEKYKFDLIKKLSKANSTLKFEPDFYFGENARPLPGMTVPCTGWNFNTFVENVAVAYAALREGERKLTRKEKYEHVMECFAELDNIFAQTDDLAEHGITDIGTYADQTLKLVSEQMLDASFQYGADDPLGEKIYLNDADLTTVVPDVADLDIDAVIDEFMGTETGEETKGDVYFSATPSTSDGYETPKTKLQAVIDCFQQDDYSAYSNRAEILVLMHRISIGEVLTVKEENLLSLITQGKPLVNYDTTIDVQDNKTEECSRRQRIMQKRQRKIMDPNYSNMCKVTYFDNWGEPCSLIKVSDYYTCWGGEDNAMTFPGEKFENYLTSSLFTYFMHEDMLEHQVDHPRIMDHMMHTYTKYILELSSDHKFYYPNRAPYTSEQVQKGDSGISIDFLTQLKKMRGDWYLDVSKLYSKPFGMREFTMGVNGVQKTYYVPVDIAYILSLNRAFLYTASLFANLAPSQQDDMVRTAVWIKENMYTLNSQSIRERIFTIGNTVKRTLMAHIYFTKMWLWANTDELIKIAGKVVLFAACVYGIVQLGNILGGHQPEPTSKFLHRSQVRTGMQYRGTPTSAFFNPGNTQELLAQQYLDKNVKFFQCVTADGMRHAAHGVHTKQFLIINSHVAEVFLKGPTSILYRPTVNSDVEWEIEIWPQQIVLSPGNDLAIIYSRHLPMAKDILNHFITEEDFQGLESVGELWSLTNFENKQAIEVRNTCVPHQKVDMTNKQGQYVHMSYAIAVEGATVAGKSGSMLMRPSAKPGHRSIAGIQAWKVRDHYKNTIFYQVVTQEMLRYLIQQVELQVGRPVITQEGPIICEPTSAKVESIVSSHINIEGSIPPEQVVGMIARTQFRKTAIAPFMDCSAYTSPRVPAALNPWDHRLLMKNHPMEHSVNKHGTGKVGSFDLAILDRASQDMAYWLRERLDVRTFNTNLSLETIVTGIRESGSNPVDCRKSAGLPYVLDKYPGKPKGKKAYVDINEDGECVVTSPEFAAQFESTYEQLRNGVIPKHSSYDFPKDELRPYYKALGDPVKGTPPKTRSVTCMNMEFIFAWRRVTLELMASLHRAARGNFPFGPGINPEGHDWTRLYHYLNKHPHALDFDVSNWDGHMPPELLYAVGDMLCIIMNIPYNSPEGKVIFSLLTEVLFGHVQFQDLVYQKCRGLISGFPGTAEVNTLVHLLLMYYFYLYTAFLTDNTQYANISDFFLHISPVFYGDDVIMTISDELIGWFNGQTIAQMYINHGYPVTSANKDQEIPKSKLLNDCTFLKSGFRPINHSRVDRVMDLSVCYDLMYWVRAKEHPYDQFRSNLFDSFRLVHGHGKATYEKVLTQVNGWLRKASLPPFDFRWEDFEIDKIQKYYSD